MSRALCCCVEVPSSCGSAARCRTRTLQGRTGRTNRRRPCSTAHSAALRQCCLLGPYPFVPSPVASTCKSCVEHHVLLRYTSRLWVCKHRDGVRTDCHLNALDSRAHALVKIAVVHKPLWHVDQSEYCSEFKMEAAPGLQQRPSLHRARSGTGAPPS